MQRVPFAYIMHSIFGLLTKREGRGKGEEEREQPSSHLIVVVFFFFGQRRITVSVDRVVCLIEFVRKNAQSPPCACPSLSLPLALVRHVINNNLLLR